MDSFSEITDNIALSHTFCYKLNTSDYMKKEWLAGATPCTKIVDQTDSAEAKTPILNLYSLVAPQP